MQRNKNSLIKILLFVLLAAALALVVFLRAPGRGQTEKTPVVSEAPPAVTEQPAESTAPPEEEPDYLPSGTFQDRYEQNTELYSTQYLDYSVMVPEKATEGLPLLIYLPGDNSNDRPEQIPTYELAQRLREFYGDEFPFIVLLPCTRFFEWHDGWIAEVLMGLVEKTVEDYKIDTDRIIITGYSRGAVAVWQYIEENGDYFCCGVPVSCGAKLHDYEAFKNVPIWAMYGGWTYDSTTYGPDIRYNIDRINEAGGNAKYTVVPDADHDTMGYAAYTQDVFEWMLQQ